LKRSPSLANGQVGFNSGSELFKSDALGTVESAEAGVFPSTRDTPNAVAVVAVDVRKRRRFSIPALVEDGSFRVAFADSIEA
jgi:hypothetical protein